MEHRTGAKTPRRMTEQRLRNVARAYLDRYDASEASLRAVLQRRVQRAAQAYGEDPAAYEKMIEAQITEAVRAGVVNNKRFAENQVHRQRARGASSRSIQARLKAKGIDAALIDEALSQDERDDVDAAWRYAERRRLGPFRHRDRSDKRERDLAALCRAGFGFGLAASVIDAERDEAPT